MLEKIIIIIFFLGKLINYLQLHFYCTRSSCVLKKSSLIKYPKLYFTQDGNFASILHPFYI